MSRGFVSNITQNLNNEATGNCETVRNLKHNYTEAYQYNAVDDMQIDFHRCQFGPGEIRLFLLAENKDSRFKSKTADKVLQVVLMDTDFKAKSRRFYYQKNLGDESHKKQKQKIGNYYRKRRNDQNGFQSSAD